MACLISRKCYDNVMIKFYNGKRLRPREEVEAEIMRYRDNGFNDIADEAEARLNAIKKKEADYTRNRRATDDDARARANKSSAAYREKNLQKINEVRARIEETNKRRAVALLGNACSKCKRTDIPFCALDLHHIDPSTKKFTLSGSRMVQKWESIEEEVMKCRLLCAICHRVEHTDAAWKKETPNGKKKHTDTGV
jgi:hypothetical protein